MTEQNPDLRPHLEEPVHISTAIDAVHHQLLEQFGARAESDQEVEKIVSNYFDELLDEHRELYHAYYWSNRGGAPLSSEKEARLDKIQGVFLEIAHLSNERDQDK